MKLFYSVLAIIISLMIGGASSAYAQASADSYFEKAVKAQQTMTIASQNNAIKNFELAKKCYDSQSKKDLCDLQIRTCKNTIKLIREKETAVVEDSVAVEKISNNATPVKQEPVTVNIQLSKKQVTFKAKGGESSTIEVSTEGHAWQYSDVPEWLTVSSNETHLVIISQANETDEERIGSIKIQSGDSEAQVFVSQKPNRIAKIKEKTKELVNSL